MILFWEKQWDVIMGLSHNHKTNVRVLFLLYLFDLKALFNIAFVQNFTPCFILRNFPKDLWQKITRGFYFPYFTFSVLYIYIY